MAFDFKKEYKAFYMPKNTPCIVTVPSMNYLAVRGMGDPNQEDGDYKQAIGLLYGIAFTIKMSKKGDHQIDGYFDYVWKDSGGRKPLLRSRILMRQPICLRPKGGGITCRMGLTESTMPTRKLSIGSL